jgi:hypothetical protein
MPGYLVSRILVADLPSNVQIRIRPDESITLLYDGPFFLGKVLQGKSWGLKEVEDNVGLVSFMKYDLNMSTTKRKLYSQ